MSRIDILPEIHDEGIHHQELPSVSENLNISKMKHKPTQEEQTIVTATPKAMQISTIIIIALIVIIIILLALLAYTYYNIYYAKWSENSGQPARGRYQQPQYQQTQPHPTQQPQPQSAQSGVKSNEQLQDILRRLEESKATEAQKQACPSTNPTESCSVEETVDETPDKQAHDDLQKNSSTETQEQTPTDEETDEEQKLKTLLSID